MKKKTVAGIIQEAKTKRSEKCIYNMEHRYEYLFLHLIVQNGSYRILKCQNCDEIIKECIAAYEEDLVTN